MSIYYTLIMNSLGFTSSNQTQLLGFKGNEQSSEKHPNIDGSKLDQVQNNQKSSNIHVIFKRKNPKNRFGYRTRGKRQPIHKFNKSSRKQKFPLKNKMLNTCPLACQTFRPILQITSCYSKVNKQIPMSNNSEIEEGQIYIEPEMESSTTPCKSIQGELMPVMPSSQYHGIETMWKIGPGKANNFSLWENLIKYDHSEWAHVGMDTPLNVDKVISEFQIRIFKSQYNHIYIGVTTLLGLRLPCNDHNIDKHTTLSTGRYCKIEGQKYLLAAFRERDLVRVIIDWRTEVMYWMVNQGLVHRQKIPGLNLLTVYPCIELHTVDDIIQWVQQ